MRLDLCLRQVLLFGHKLTSLMQALVAAILWLALCKTLDQMIVWFADLNICESSNNKETSATQLGVRIPNLLKGELTGNTLNLNYFKANLILI